MNVASIAWRIPGCGDSCQPKRHDPYAHEVYGMLTALRTPPVRIVRTGPLVIDLDGKRATVAGQVVALSGREWAILAHLAERVGKFCPNDEILAHAFGPEWITGRRALHRQSGRGGRTTGTFNVDWQRLTVYLTRLRTKLGAAGAYVETVSHQGAAGRRLRWEPTL